MAALAACKSKSSTVAANSAEGSGAVSVSPSHAVVNTLDTSPSPTPRPPAPALRLAYSDEPGAAEWATLGDAPELTRHGVYLSMTEYEPVAALEALAGGRVDAVATTNADVLVNRSLGTPCTVITPTWVSHGAEFLLASKEVPTVTALHGHVIGVEFGRPEHLWLERTLMDHGLAPKDVRLVNLIPQLANQALSERTVTAAALSSPDSALRPRPGTHTLATSAQGKPFYYGVLCVTPTSLQARGEHWRQVVRAWTETTSAARAEQNPPLAAATVTRKLVSSTEVSMETLLAATSLLDDFFVRTRAYAQPSLRREDFDYPTLR